MATILDDHDVSVSDSNKRSDPPAPDNVTPAPRKEKTQFEVWNYVTRYCKDKKKLSWKCMKCDSTFSMRTSTRIIRNHLHRHGYLLQKVTQKRFGDSWTLMEERPIPIKELQANLERNILKWIVKSQYPLSCVEDPAFRKMVSQSPNVRKLSRHTLQLRIMEAHKARKLDLIADLKNAREK